MLLGHPALDALSVEVVQVGAGQGRDLVRLLVVDHANLTLVDFVDRSVGLLSDQSPKDLLGKHVVGGVIAGGSPVKILEKLAHRRVHKRTASHAHGKHGAISEGVKQNHNKVEKVEYVPRVSQAAIYRESAPRDLHGPEPNPVTQQRQYQSDHHCFDVDSLKLSDELDADEGPLGAQEFDPRYDLNQQDQPHDPIRKAQVSE